MLLELPPTLLVARYSQYAVLLETYNGLASVLTSKMYSIPYYGYRLDVAILPYDRIVKHERLIHSQLVVVHPKAKLAFIQ